MSQGTVQLEEFRTLVRDRINVIEFIGQYTTLTRAGSRWKGLCPLHQEKTSSFSVDEDSGLWYCFGCAKGGDLFTFLQEKEGLNFREAADLLSDRFGLPLLGTSSGQQRGPDRSQQQLLLDLHLAACTLFREYLFSPQGTPYRDYLKAREFGRADAERFQLGAAPDSWDFLTGALLKQGFRAEDCLLAGLASRSDSKPGSIYDRFRGRLIIPICDRLHRPIAFGGRIVGEGEPKYLNSPETPLFHKQKVLFALDLARDAIRQRGQVLLMEGYTDVMRAHQKGLGFAVAAMGTALTKEQITELTRSAQEVLLFLDSDQAGMKAAFKHAAALVQAQVPAKVLRIPPGQDPDDFLRAAPDPAAALDQLIRSALPAMAFLLRAITPRDAATLAPEERRALIEQGARLIALLPTQPEREEYLDRWSRQLTWDRNRVRQIAWPWIKSGTAAASPTAADTSDVTLSLEEERLLRTLLADPLSRQMAVPHLRGHDFNHPAARRLLEVLEDEEDHTAITDPASLPAAQLDPELRELVIRLLVGEEPPIALADLQPVLVRYRLRRVREEQNRLLAALEAAQEAQDHRQVAVLIREVENRGRELFILQRGEWPADLPVLPSPNK